MAEAVDTIVIGGGQAGLAVSYYLCREGREHIVLEQAALAGEAWRNHRWDSFAFVTPNRMIRMPGAEYEGSDPDGFLPRDQIVRYFEEYARRFNLPVRYGVRVSSVEQEGEGYRLATQQGEYRAVNVIVATGSFQNARIPSFAREIPTDVQQLSSDSYRNPGSLKPGAVLVVGCGQSGSQIAEELYMSGRKVYLTVGRVGRVPRRYRGQDITAWLVKTGFFDRPAAQLPSPKARFDANPQVSGSRGGHSLNLHQFARDGVTLLGRLKDVREGKVFLAADLKESLARTDTSEADMLKRIDGYIEKAGLRIPTESFPVLRDGYAAEPLLELDLLDAGVSNIVRAMGFQFDYSLVKALIFDEYGYPFQERGVTACPGLYFAGLNWMHTFKSGLLFGVGEDAEHVTSHIMARGSTQRR
jgi:putative flavoprotein involved in K+ transport